MGLFDVFKVKDFKAEAESLRKELDNLKENLSPEMNDVIELNHQIKELTSNKLGIENEISTAKNKLVELKNQIEEKNLQLIEKDEEILLQEFGFYKPRYEFSNSEQYKNKLNEIRIKQKELIKNNTAVNGNTDWSVNGSSSKGKKMVKDMQKLLLRAFNTECDGIISKVKYNNYDVSLKRITSSKDAISKLGVMMGISISNEYYYLKVDELNLALEFQQQKQKEKEDLKMQREQLREEAKLQKEIEEARRNIEKEQKHYQNALEKAKLALDSVTNEDEKKTWEAKVNELNNSLERINKNLAAIDYREANKKAGYVYIISNIGSFGENIYKIGMTRRLDPMERIYELGDASVPFNFDVHAMIFSDDAPKLEAALHNAFSDKKLNMVNTRREFFNVSLEEIEQVVKTYYEKSVEFIKIADAEQYRLSLKIKDSNLHIKD